MHISGVIIDSHAGTSSDEPVRLRVADGRVHHESPSTSAPAEISGYILPGLVDVHCHIGLQSDGAADDATTLAQARAVAATGVLAVRDAGSPRDTRFLHTHDDVPHLIRSGRHLALAKRYIRDYGLELEDSAQLPEAIVAQARAGDGWVKIVGDWIDRDTGDLSPLWDREDLVAAVGAAHTAGARVTVHTFAHETISDLFAAGVDCIEHGTGMSHEDMAYVADRGIPVVPTLLQVAQFGEFAEQGQARFPQYAARMRAMFDRADQQLRDFYEAGVMLMVGSDAGGGLAHGNTIEEATAWVDAQIPADEVVAALSWRTRIYLGLPLLSDGAPADFVVYSADPRQDISVLHEPLAIFRAGKRIR